ncbi:cytochrome c [Deinococcus sp. HMF7604]|uniref:c-type cytochrome n=1 Tax=Deinococcus betulae TaxID=2873312 RepID=UPI001CC94465|nr:cytochrome c [Deinococcus betulae]MBZ9753561.1 cytochrome c [Deinococcus betulae]
MNEARNRIAGSVLSWALGVTLGVILGVALLILTPRTMGKPAEVMPGSTLPASESAQVGQGAEGMQGEGETASGDEAGAENTSGDTQEEGASTEETGGEATEEGAEGAATEENRAEETNTVNETSAQEPTDEEVAAVGAESEGNIEAGQTIYVSNCSGCHAPNGAGAVGPSLLSDEGVKSWTVAQLVTVLREGRTPTRQLSNVMPRFSEAQISDEQVADLHAYIKTLN